MLTLDKLYSLRLDRDMVTLSACETDLGKIAGGDVAELTRGFLYAGSRSIVAGLWKVDDLATSQLMTLFDPPSWTPAAGTPIPITGRRSNSRETRRSVWMLRC